MIPFDSWDGINDYSGTLELTMLERYFGPAAIVFSSYHASISAILEILGSRSNDIPVILPVTISPEVLSGVLRSGATPFLLDIEPNHFQIDPELLKEVIGELNGGVIILNRPAGIPVNPELLEICKDLPTIIDTRLPPSLDIEADCVGSFSVFDFAPIIGSGALIIHRFAQQVNELKMVRNGLLGLSANLNDALSALASKRLHDDHRLDNYKKTRRTVVGNYIKCLKDRNMEYITGPDDQHMIVSVPDADRVIAYLHGEGFALTKPIFPLHMLSHVNKRWAQKPEYPVAESIQNNYVALPVHAGILEKEAHLISKMSEVT